MVSPPSDAEAQVRAILTSLFPDHDIGGLAPDADLGTALDIDSMARIDLVLEIERRTGVHVPDEDIERLTSIQVAAAYVDERLGQTRGATNDAPRDDRD